MSEKNIILDDRRSIRVIFIKTKNLFNIYDIEVDKH